ncbi:MAG: 4Fe-4S binding protein [Treponema sp.]|nr:4Fe-4S binding protein [Treponema sp.]
MAYKIDVAKCVNCGTCEPDCPAGAISEADGHRQIDPAQCLSCGTCASECPAEAISEE